MVVSLVTTAGEGRLSTLSVLPRAIQLQLPESACFSGLFQGQKMQFGSQLIWVSRINLNNSLYMLLFKGSYM